MELPGKRELREQILHQMDGRTSYVSDKDVYREIDKAILRSSHGGYGTLSEKEELRRQMFYSIRGFDVLEKYLGDSSISEIMVIGASRIFVEQNGKNRRTLFRRGRCIPLDRADCGTNKPNGERGLSYCGQQTSRRFEGTYCIAASITGRAGYHNS